MHDPHLKSYICIENIAVEGTISQIFYIGPSYFLMKCRNGRSKNKSKNNTFPYIFVCSYVFSQNQIYQHTDKENPFHLMYETLKSHCL